jgi:soluble lytic murein transglycosylase-like protein
MARFRIKKLRQYRKQLYGFAGGIIVSALIVGGYIMIMHSQVAMPYQNQGVTIAWLPSTATRFKSEIDMQAKRYNIDANFIAIIMTLESGGYTQANSGQAEGLMQITPTTAGDIAKKYLKTPTTKYNLTDADTSIEFGAAYLAHLRDVFCDYSDGPSWNACAELIAAGYNGGPGAANQLYLGNGLADVQTATYSRNAINMWREKAAKTSPTYDRWLEAGGQSLVDKAQAEKKQ